MGPVERSSTKILPASSICRDINHPMDETGIGLSSKDGQTFPGPTPSPAPPLSRAFLFVPVCGLIGATVALSRYRPIHEAPFLGLLFILFFATVFLTSRIQQKARRGGDVSSFFPIIYWLAFGPVVLGLALWLNGALDHSPPESHRQLVTRKFITHGRNGPGYYIELTSWREDRTTEKVSVSHQQYDQFQIDDPIVIDVQRGALAIPWIGKVRKPQAEDLN